jgi:hypothetical protein
MADEEVEQPTVPVRESRRGGLAVTLIIILLLGGGIFQYYRANQLATALELERGQVKQLQNEIESIRREANDSTTKFNELTKQRLPVSVVFRRDLVSKGIIAFFKNEAPTTVEVSAVLSDPTSDRRQQVRLVLNGDGVQQIGPQQGWSFAPGQHVRLIHAQFGVADYIVPPDEVTATQ